MKAIFKIGFMLCLSLAATAWAKGEQQTGKTIHRRTPVTAVIAVAQDLELWEFSVGQLESKVAPLIAAEVAGRLTAVNVDVGDTIQKGQLLASIDTGDFKLVRDESQTDIDRLQALIHAQQLKVQRYRELVEKQSVNQSSLDDAEAQFGALRAELASARVRLQQAQRDIRKTQIVSPIDGQVDATRVSKGDYVKAGSPLMRISNSHWLRARLPYPETLLSKLKAGLPVRLSSPSSPTVTVETTVSDMRPSITFGSRSAQIIVNVENPGPWEPGATVTGAVRIALHKSAVMLPEVSVVRRPVGSVVYTISEGKAVQRVVTVGLRRAGRVEILVGLKVGERVVADGAGFLSDGALLTVKAP